MMKNGRNMSCESDEWEENEFLDFKELEDQITQIVDNGNLEEMLKIQLSELEMLQSMFSNPGEFCVDDHSVIADINEFVDGKSSMFPPRLDFTINLVIGLDSDMKLQVCVNLPHDYPANEPDIYVRSDTLSRNQQHALNRDLANFISTLDRGEICICSAISWLQEEAIQYYGENKSQPKVANCNESEKFLARYWVYSHHIYSKIKRREMLDLANEYSITGFCLPGRPGIICAEGSAWDCDEWWQKVKFMNWKKIMCKKKEMILLDTSNKLDSLRKFDTFQEVSFNSGKGKSRDFHMDMGELYRYLANHDCSYVFKDYFGVDGKGSNPQQHPNN